MDNPLRELTNFFKKMNPQAIGLDIGSSSIKVVQLKKQGGRAVLETYGELSLGPYGGSNIGSAVKLYTSKTTEALNDLLRESKVTTKNCGVAIPISSSLVTMIQLPLVDESQLAQMIPLEARKYIPVPISEVVLDWLVIPRQDVSVSYPFTEGGEQGVKGGGMADILLAVIHNDALNRYRETVQQASLEPGFFEIEIFSTIRSVTTEDQRPVMIFDMGASTTKLYIVDRGIVRGSHVINRGSQDITLTLAHALNTSVADAELLKRNYGLKDKILGKLVSDIVATTLSFILSESSRMVFNYEKKSRKQIGKVILSGGGVLFGGFLEYARGFFETDVVFAEPFSKIEYPAYMDNLLKKLGPEFAVALGLALRKLQESR
jgi:type IV pilus assembly protein PilM